MDQVERKLNVLLEQKIDQAIADTDGKSQFLIDDIQTLYGVKNEAEKARAIERKEEAERKENFKDRLLTAGLTIGTTVGGWAMYNHWLKLGLRFEEIGSVGSQWTRNLIGKLIPKLK